MHIFPLAAAAAIVFGATRDERPAHMLAHIVKSAVWIGVFLGAIMVVLLLVAWFLRS